MKIMKNSKIKIAVILFIAVSAACGYSSTDSAKNSNVGAPSNDGQSIVISAEELVGEYRENLDAANAKYNGKLLSVSGKVNGLALMNKTSAWFSLGGGTAKPGTNYRLVGVGCSFTGDEKTKTEKLNAEKLLVVESPATFLGVNAGVKQEMGAEYIVLENCKLQ